MADTPTLVIFETGFAPAGTGADGLPLFEETLLIRKSRPPYLEIHRVADDMDISDNPDAYQAFLKVNKGKKLDGKQSYPLSMWPALNPAELQMCLARDIATVEALSKIALRSRDDTIPPPIMELAKRAKRMVDLQKSHGKFEEIISSLETQVKELMTQINDQRSTMDSQSRTIASLQASKAA